MTFTSFLVVGLLLGVRHATDTDHVVAVAALASREKRTRGIFSFGISKLGAMWGAGHMLTVFGVGGAIIALGLVVPPRVALVFELAVGLMLIVIGALNLVANGTSAAPRSAARSFGVGMVHGLAGSTAIALMILATHSDDGAEPEDGQVRERGAHVANVAVTCAMSVPLVLVSRADAVQRYVGRAAGLVSVAFGLVVIWRIVAAW